MASPIGTARMPDAGIVAALGADLGLGAVAIDGAARRQDRRGRLDRKTAHDRLAGRNAAQDAARMVRQKDRLAVVAHAHFIGILFAAERRRGKAGADLDALDGVDAHERRGEIAVELAIDRRAEAGGHAFGHDLDDGADRGAALADVVEIALEELSPAAHRDRRTDCAPPRPSPSARDRSSCGPIWISAPRTRHARHDLARDRAGRNPHRGLARGLPAAAAIVADAVFDVIGVSRRGPADTCP